MKRAFYIVIGVYIVLYCTLLNQYILPSYTLVNLTWFIPLMLLVPLFIPPAMRLLDRMANVKAWTVIATITLATCIVLQLSEIKGLWISLPTVGLTIAIVVLIMNLTEGKLTSGKSLLLGCGCALIARSAMEMFYKTSFLVYYNGNLNSYYTDLLLISVGLCVGIVILLKLHSNLAHFNTAFIVCTSSFILLAIAWLATGFKTVHFYSDQEFLAPLISRSTMVSCFLAPAMLFTHRKGDKR